MEETLKRKRNAGRTLTLAVLVLGIVALVVVPLALHLLGADVKVRRCGGQAIPCGWSWKFYGSGR